MDTINDRIKQIADFYGLSSYADFAQKTGLNHQTASNYLKGKQKPDVEKLSIIKQSFEEINTEWLLTGEGNMLKDESSTPNTDISNAPKPTPTDNNSEIVKLLEDKIMLLEKNNSLIEEAKATQSKEISELKEENRNMKEELQHLRNEFIEVLKNQNKSDTNSSSGQSKAG